MFCRPDQGRHPEDTVFAHVKKKSQPLSDVAHSNEDNGITNSIPSGKFIPFFLDVKKIKIE